MYLKTWSTCMIYKNSLQMRQYEEVKNKRMEKDIPCTHDQKKAEVATLLPDKADSRKKKHYVKKDITWRQQVWSARKHSDLKRAFTTQQSYEVREEHSNWQKRRNIRKIYNFQKIHNWCQDISLNNWKTENQQGTIVDFLKSTN